jgi:hypothetical protein
MPQSDTKKRREWESGHFVLRCPFKCAALLTLGIEFAESNTPSIDNVYSSTQPWADSGGKFDLETGQIVTAPDYVGDVKFYLRPRNGDGLNAKKLLGYWDDPSEVASEIYDIERRFLAADNGTSRQRLSDDLRSLIPAAQIAYMRQATREIPVGEWERYQASEGNKLAEQRLSAMSERLKQPEADAPQMLPEYRRDFLPAMHASIHTYMSNFLTLRSVISRTLPAIRLRDLSQSRFPLVLPLGKNFARERKAFS